MKEWLTDKELERALNDVQKMSVKCKCGKTVVIANKSGIAECSQCHNNVFRDKEIEFKYRMKEKLIREKRKLK